MTGRPAPRRAALFVGGLALAILACRQALSTMVDIPPPKPAPAAAAPKAQPVVVLTPLDAPRDSARPPIERTLDPDSARALLPRDHAGNIDWMAALDRGIIRPRSTLPGDPAPTDPVPFMFAFDFHFKGPDTTFDAQFPHSKHTAWLNCQQCHARIFPYRNTPVQMADIFQGKYCAECHGKVSFPVLTGCERCHFRMPMPADRAQPELLGTLILKRTEQPAKAQAKADTTDLPPSSFPHWVHRIRYRCKACHMQLFEPRNGANTIAMKDISEGRACGRCHNGVAAFKPSIGNCERCHLPLPTSPAGAPGPTPSGP